MTILRRVLGNCRLLLLQLNNNPAHPASFAARRLLYLLPETGKPIGYIVSGCDLGLVMTDDVHFHGVYFQWIHFHCGWFSAVSAAR